MTVAPPDSNEKNPLVYSFEDVVWLITQLIRKDGFQKPGAAFV